MNPDAQTDDLVTRLDARGNFEGFVNRECGEHRTTGGRAWCFDDSEWCTPRVPCRGCELPQLRAERDEAVELLHVVTDELSCWGWGDMHYGENMPQEQRVREPVERARAFLARLRDRST